MNRRHRFQVMALVVAMAPGVLAAVPAHALSWTRFTVPTDHSSPRELVAGADENMWFIEEFADQIGRITPDGVITEFPLGNPGNFPYGIAAGPDGNVWFTEPGSSGEVARITPGGVVTEYPTPGKQVPHRITAGPDGAMWFTVTGESCSDPDWVGRIDIVTKVITEYDLPHSCLDPEGITTGPDGNIWFTVFGPQPRNLVGKLNPATGAITEYDLAPGVGPLFITAGRDGSLWFTEELAGAIGRISTSGAVTEYPIPFARQSQPLGITAFRGEVWFADNGNNAIGRIDTDGAIRLFAVGSPTKSGRNPYDIARGPGGSSLWFTEFLGNTVDVVRG